MATPTESAPIDGGGPRPEFRRRRHFLASLSSASVLADLPLLRNEVQLDTPGKQLFELMRLNPSYCGVVGMNGRNYRLTISRKTFFEALSQQFGREIYLRRSVQAFEGHLVPPALVLEGGTLVSEAVSRAFQREERLLYEPVTVVKDGMHLLLDIQDLLLAYNEIYEKNLGALQRAQETIARQAMESGKQAGKIEVASGVLHDIGNAVTAMALKVQDLLQRPDWPECANLLRTLDFLKGLEPSLVQALGPKTGPLLAMLASIEKGVRGRQNAWIDDLQNFCQALRHIQEVLQIQRQYVREGSGPKMLPLSLPRLIADALALQKGTLEKRGVEVAQVLEAGLPLVHGDSTKLVQVLINVLKNACESMDEGPSARKAVQIAARRTPEGWVVLRISDSGAGFDAGHPDYFVRGTTTKSGGSGLGLSGSRETLVALDGSIALTSPGKGLGATVEIIFKRTKDHDGLL